MKTIGFVYDADKTLFIGDAPDLLLHQNGITDLAGFWGNVDQQRKNDECPSLAYIKCLLDAGCDLSYQNLKQMGAEIQMFPGLPNFFDRVNHYAAKRELNVEHYIISAGLKGMIEGSPIADRLTKVYACHLENGWPINIVNDTMKTGHLADIYKGVPHGQVTRNTKGARHIAYRDMLIFGDGMTDVPMLVFGKNNGAHCFAVHDGQDAQARKLYDEGRVHHAVPADYREGSTLDLLVKQRIDQL